MSEVQTKIDPDDLEELREQGIVPLSSLAVFSFRSLCCLAVCFGLTPVLVAEATRVWSGGTYLELASALLPWLIGLLVAGSVGSLLAVLIQSKGLFRLKFVGFAASRLGFNLLKLKDYFWRVIIGLLIIAGTFLFIGLFIYAGAQRVLPLLNRSSGLIPQELKTTLQAYGFILLFALLLLAISAWLARRILFMITQVKK